MLLRISCRGGCGTWRHSTPPDPSSAMTRQARYERGGDDTKKGLSANHSPRSKTLAFRAVRGSLGLGLAKVAPQHVLRRSASPHLWHRPGLPPKRFPHLIRQVVEGRMCAPADRVLPAASDQLRLHEKLLV